MIEHKQKTWINGQTFNRTLMKQKRILSVINRLWKSKIVAKIFMTYEILVKVNGRFEWLIASYELTAEQGKSLLPAHAWGIKN